MLTEDDANKKVELESFFELPAWFGLLISFALLIVVAVNVVFFAAITGALLAQLVALILFNALGALYALFFAALTHFSATLFAFLAALLALFDTVLLVVVFIGLFAVLAADTVDTLAIVVQAFIVIAVAVYTGIAISYVITAVQYTRLLERVAARSELARTEETEDEEKSGGASGSSMRRRTTNKTSQN